MTMESAAKQMPAATVMHVANNAALAAENVWSENSSLGCTKEYKNRGLMTASNKNDAMNTTNSARMYWNANDRYQYSCWAKTAPLSFLTVPLAPVVVARALPLPGGPAVGDPADDGPLVRLGGKGRGRIIGTGENAAGAWTGGGMCGVATDLTDGVDWPPVNKPGVASVIGTGGCMGGTKGPCALPDPVPPPRKPPSP